ncbi:MAG: hypothetical protein AAB850_02705 [Patescibacteria group bacterium]
MPFAFKKIATPLVLASFLIIAFFGFASMSYGPDGSMQGDCPFSSMGTSLCPINVYQSFISVPLNLIPVLLILASAVFVFLFHAFLYRPLAPLSYSSPPFTSHNRKMKRWLSLFEHSPSR